MIKRMRRPDEYEAAECDGCGRDLRQDGGGAESVNHGTLKASFGWPSPLDDAGGGAEYHLCEGCWVRALGLFGLPVWVDSTGERSMPDGAVLDEEGGVVGAWDVQAAVEAADGRRRKPEGAA